MRRLIIDALLLLLLISFTGVLATGAAQSGRIRPATARSIQMIESAGLPNFMGISAGRRFILWREGNWWHIRSLTGGQKHSFSGRILSQRGTIDLVSINGSLDRVAQASNIIPVMINSNGQQLNFEYSTSDELAGFNFYTEADSITFDLTIDGKHTTENILVGGKGNNPTSIPFTLSNE
jgi:hypothetical protein